MMTLIYFLKQISTVGFVLYL